jgi:catechol 2,3-dioxygenase
MSEIIHPATTLGAIHLNVSNLDIAINFYKCNLGFKLHRMGDNIAYMGAGRKDLLVLHEVPGARNAPGRTGLYHFAVLLPSRIALAQSLQRLIETQTPIQGFSDHLVSEAIYLADPDGNGIELYRDRPREQWPYQEGQLRMATEHLDVDELLAELKGHDTQWDGFPEDTIIGHIHLHVADIEQAERFYRDILGFECVQRYGPSATFLSAGGYHHHIGANTWAGRGIAPPPAGSAGLNQYVIQLPDQTELQKVLARIRASGITIRQQNKQFIVKDPSHNHIALQSA